MSAEDWTPNDYIAWLDTGFTRLADHPAAVEQAWAFAPLRFNPESSVIGQLTTLFASPQFHKLDVASHLRVAIEAQLREVKELDYADGDPDLVINLWRLYPALPASPNLVPIARLSLKGLEASMFPEALRPTLVDVVAGAVARMPASDAVLSFFNFLHAQKALWQDHLVMLVAGKYLNDATRREAGWRTFRHRFGAALAAVADPKTAMGRAFIRQLTRLLLPEIDLDHVPNTEAEATRLRLRLALDERVDEIADRLAWRRASRALPSNVIEIVRWKAA